AQLRQVELEADHEHQEDDAELGEVGDAGGIAGKGQRVRADEHADGEIAEDRWQARKAAGDDANDGSEQKEQRLFERGGHWRAQAEQAGANPRIGRSYWTDSPPQVSAPTSFDAARALELARATLDIEARAIEGLKARQGESFVAAMKAMLACRGRFVVMGMGKSGHVGRKVAATLASTGTPAFFVHPGEASHGDLGMVTPADVVLAISNSGESDEIGAIVPAIKRLGATLVTMTGGADRNLARHADIVLSRAVDQEACPLNLAPTASTTAQMALGDALAVALLDARGFCEDDFARSHPGGSLGRKLLMHVADLMHGGAEVPRVGADTLVP